jgi:copper resistance protein C
VVITSAVFGLTTVGSAGVALGAAGPIGHSPAGKVVRDAPTAVSVTFDEPLRAGGARMRVLTKEGDVGVGQVTTGRRTLRRELRANAPAGSYTVQWTAVSAKGRKMSGSFSFTAARSKGAAVITSSPVPSPRVTVAVRPTAQPASAPPTSAGPTGTAGAGTSPSATPAWISGSGSLGTPEPTNSAVAALPADGSDHSGSDRSVSTGFTAVPLTVGGLLVLAAGLVSLFHRPRLNRSA